ncbi:hypothetical protein EMIT0P395_70211 [Pseudomonas sp. IT-P395]
MPCTVLTTSPSPVGVSLLAIALCQSINNDLTHRYREQAHSYKGSGSDSIVRPMR